MNVMNKTLAIQLSRIQGYDTDDVAARKINWVRLYKSRQEFLGKLEKELESKGYELGTKERSRAYSDAVVKYDSQFIGG